MGGGGEAGRGLVVRGRWFCWDEDDDEDEDDEDDEEDDDDDDDVERRTDPRHGTIAMCM